MHDHLFRENAAGRKKQLVFVKLLSTYFSSFPEKKNPYLCTESFFFHFSINVIKHELFILGKYRNIKTLKANDCNKNSGGSCSTWPVESYLSAQQGCLAG